MRRVDLDDLNLFQHIAEAGSITAGAARANLALAAASTKLRDLEIDFGTKLMVRTHRGVTLTPSGDALLVHARRLLASAHRMDEEMAAYAGKSGGHVRLMCNTNAVIEFLPAALGRYLADHPGTTIDLQERLSDEIVGLVAEGKADLGIVAGTVETGPLQILPFRTDRFVIIAAENDPLAERRSVKFTDILDRDFVGLDRTSALEGFLRDRAARLGRKMRLRVQLRSFDAVCLMVSAGVGIGIVPETTARRLMGNLAIRTVLLEDNWALRDLRICMQDQLSLSPSAKRLITYLCAADPKAQT